ncbi:RpiR family transcriptional regulator [Marinilactibacillus sp. 15R]|uniref:MurR/RpiR family transcriptional regulator n=1 Tax=Marinilactibacillus sp. 15R TaxID=1911586 RepID=UPI000909FB7C|nr:MurR/RpiR family transcriptional regulator [Marinilactibacillus sp. 15R]API88776.1 RpiR family transcriptional regulator [Marinilactibacillus sp. 15R]
MGLLIHRLITILNTEDPDSTNYHIALTLVLHYTKISRSSIKEIADLCSVSKSTISKFARTIGFDDYYHLKESAPFIENRFHFNFNYLTNILGTIDSEGLAPYFDAITKDINYFKENLDLETIDQLAKDLVSYDQVYAFGLLFSETAAVDLQYKLAYLQKFIVTRQEDTEQERIIETARDDKLIIIFSNSGEYVKKHQLKQLSPRQKIFEKSNAKIVLITSNPEMLENENIDYCILFHHETNMQTHHFMYQIITDMIALRYRYYSTKQIKE